MTQLRFTETAVVQDATGLSKTRLTDEGYLVANVRTARTGVQQYLGSELDRPDLAMVNVYRDEKEVFRKASLQTFGLLPVTDDHPPELVTADTAKAVSVGTTNEEVLRDGEYLRIGLKVTDAATVQKVLAGKRQLSVGYTSQIEWGDGVAPDGTPYQARQTNIVGNHIAIVSAARAGPLAGFGDGAPAAVARWGASPITDGKDPIMADANTRTVMVDGLSVVTTDAGAVAIEKLQRVIADMKTEMTEKEKKAQEEADKKDKEIGTKDAEIAKLTKGALTDADLDARVAARSDLIGKAKSIAKDLATTGLSDAAIRKAAVVAVLDDASIKDRSDAYVEARFDTLVEDAAKGDPVAAALQDSPAAKDARAIADKAWEDHLKSLQDAHKGAAAAAK